MHTEKEQFGRKLTLNAQDLHRNFRERSSTSEGEHQFRLSHEQFTEVYWPLRKSLRRCSESQCRFGAHDILKPGISRVTVVIYSTVLNPATL
jgi:hypothetical protein